MLLGFFLVSSRLLVKVLGSQKLYTDFRLCRGLLPLISMLFRGQLYIKYYQISWICLLLSTATNLFLLLLCLYSLFFLQDPLVTNHCLQVMCQPLWHGDVRHLSWSVPPHFQPLCLLILPPAVLSSVKFPWMCCDLLFLCICVSFLLFVQVFPYLFFLSPSGDLIILGGWASMLAPHEAFCNTYCQAQSTVLCLCHRCPVCIWCYHTI